jgi:flavin-binding protein dodecin
LASALEHFTGEVGYIRIAAIDKNNGPYSIPVDLVINQYSPESWNFAIKEIINRAKESTNSTIVILQHETSQMTIKRKHYRNLLSLVTALF